MPINLPPDLSATQAALWLDQQLFVGKPVYNTGQVLTVRGRLRTDLFEIALRETIAESPGLRLAPWSVAPSLDLTLLDFRGEADPRAAAEAWMRAEMGRAISLDDPALFRFALIRIGEDQTLWFQKYHHIIIDATGRRLLSARTAQRYRALRFGEPLPALDAATPEELLEVERQYGVSSNHEADRSYWLQLFARWPGPLHEANRQNTERIRSGRHARITFGLKRADFTRLDQAASRSGSSAFRAIIALTFAAFARLYDRYDIVLGLELANRADARTRQTIGFVARPLPMLLALAPGTSIATALDAIEAMRVRNYPHRHFPIQELARDLGITRKGHHGLFDIIVNYIPAAYDFAFEDGPVEITNLSYGFSSPWTVTIADTGCGRDLDVSIDSDPGLVPADMAARLAISLETLLLQGLEDPACPLASLPIMPRAMRERVLGLASGKSVAGPQGTTLAALCAAQAEKTPDAVALRFGEQQLSFATLHAQAACLARRLAFHGVGPGVVVGIALPRTPDMVIAVLAVHKAGGAYLALDPSYPAERIAFIVGNAAAPVIITNSTLAPLFAESGARLLLETEPAHIDAESADPVAAGPDDLAYVLYTSGSTGRPKAVGIEHRNLINLIGWGRSMVSDAELRGLLFSTSLNFDLSAFEMFLPLVHGGCIILVENLLTIQSAPHRDSIRLINTGPSLIDALLRSGDLPPGLTTVILAGEKLPRHLATSLFEAAPGIRLLNCYGPTETTVYSSCATIDPADRSEPTIGRAIWNTTLYVLGSGCALMPPGAEGELFIGGAGVARGYLGRPDLTAERFLPNPYGPGNLYRTGDRVRWRADGELEFYGRADDQMKINGIRIEPGEIEAALLALPGIAAAVVTLCEDAAKVRRLTAYLVSSSGASPAEQDVRAALERQLPRNMVPAYFVWLDALPMTPNGKLDRKSLPAPAREPERSRRTLLPETAMEREVAAIWQDLLGVSPIDVGSDFFDLGGDSLALLSLFATVEARFGRRLTVDVLAGGLTVSRLAQVLTEGEPLQAAVDPVVVLQPDGDRPPFFCVHGIGGDVVHLHRLAMHMGTGRPFFGIRRAPEPGLTDSIGQLAARYIAAMLNQQPVGPFYLGGYSFGAIVAYEMAVQLARQGHEVGLLAILDQRKPGWRLTPLNALPALPRMIARVSGRLRDELGRASSTGRTRRIGRMMASWWKTALGDLPDAVSLVGRHGEMDYVQMDAHLRAMRNYEPEPLSAPITLIRANEQMLSHLALDSTLGWRDVAKSEVKVLITPGSHTTITVEPLVRQLAKTLSEELDAAQSVAAMRRQKCADHAARSKHAGSTSIPT
jgi:amino acid adenylation domain-containing protein